MSSLSRAAATAAAAAGVTQSTEPGTVVLEVQGMSCASCVAALEGALKQCNGVLEATVNLASNQVSLQTNIVYQVSLQTNIVYQVSLQTNIVYQVSLQTNIVYQVSRSFCARA